MRHEQRQTLAHQITWACGKANEAISRNDHTMAEGFLRDAEKAWTELRKGMKHDVLAEKLPAELQAEKMLTALRKTLQPQKHMD